MKYEAIEAALKNAQAEVNTALKAVQVAKMKDTAVSCRIQIGRYFKMNGNKPVHYRTLAAAIGRDPAYVACILSGHYEFRNTRAWSGRWKMRANWLKKVQ